MLKLDENLIGTPHVYTIASMSYFHAGFGKSDLMRVFWDSTNSTRSCIAAADMREERRQERSYFQSQRLVILEISSFLWAVECSHNREKDVSLVEGKHDTSYIFLVAITFFQENLHS